MSEASTKQRNACACGDAYQAEIARTGRCPGCNAEADSAKLPQDLAELADALEQFNIWRRSDKPLPMPDPSEVGCLIDQAVSTLRTIAAPQPAPQERRQQPSRPLTEDQRREEFVRWYRESECSQFVEHIFDSVFQWAERAHGITATGSGEGA